MELSDQDLEQWDGYELEVFGGLIDGSTPDDGHTWTINLAEEGQPPLKIRLDRQWVHYKDSPVRGELLRIPSQPEQRSIQWLDDRIPSDNHLARARDGLALLDGLPKLLRGPGRPPSIHTKIKVRGPDEYRERIHKRVYQKVARGSDLRRFDKKTSAGWLGLSLTTIRNYQRDFGIGWDDIFDWHV